VKNRKIANRKSIHAAAKSERLIAMSGDVTIKAAEMDGDKPKGPPTFSIKAYNGGPLNVEAFDHPVVVDLAGLQPRKTMVANLDHKAHQRVGNVTAVANDHKTLDLSGAATAHTPYRDEVVASAADGFTWQASIESTAPAAHTEFLKPGKKATVNAQTVVGPAYIVRKSTLKGFAFVSHGADDNTSVNIAATAASNLEKNMDPKFVEWLEAQGLDPEVIAEDEKLCKTLTAAWQKENPKPKKPVKKQSLEAQFAAQEAEQERCETIEQLGLKAGEAHPHAREAILLATDEAIEGKMDAEKFELELFRLGAGADLTRFNIGSSRNRNVNTKVLEAAICKTGGMPDDKLVRSDKNRHGYDEQTLDAMDRDFPHGIGLNQFIAICAEMQGYRVRHAGRVTVEAQNAAFGLDRNIRASFSTIVAPNIMANVAGKFLRIGWDAVDMTPLRIAAITPVNDFKEISTVSLVADATLKKVGATGEIEHGSLGEVAYGNKADTYARLLAITRQDYRNDDLRALTSAPKKLGRGAGLALNFIFWTEFLNNSSFFASGNNNVNTGVADATIGGLAATEAIFLNQTDPNGDPLLSTPAIVLVPTALKATMAALLDPQSKIVSGATGGQSDLNVFAGRFRL